MTIVVDTSVAIDHLRGRAEATRALTRALDEGQRLTASVLTKMELEAGLRPGEEPVTHRFYDALEWATVDDAIAVRAGELAQAYRSSHSGADAIDFLIASTALSLEASLWTRNVRHFPMFADLRSPY